MYQNPGDVPGAISNGETSAPQQSQPINQSYARLPFPTLTGSSNIEYWFRQLESWFTLQNITNDKIRFETVVATLTPTLFDQAVEVINEPPETESYIKLKTVIISRFADSEYTRVNSLLSSVPLGAQRPGHLLADIRRIGATQDDKLLRVCWLRRLPAHIRAVVSVSKGNLSEQAEMADAVYDSLQNENSQLFAATAVTSSEPPNQAVKQQNHSTTNDNIQAELLKRIEQLTICIAEIKNERQSRSSNNSHHRSASRGHSQSRGDTQGPSTCWYHRNFGVDAVKCVQPCNFLGPGMQQSNIQN